MPSESDTDQRIKELEALIKAQDLADRRSPRALLRQSFLTTLPIVLTVGLGFVANYTQSRGQHQEQLELIAAQGRLERDKQAASAREGEKVRGADAYRSFLLQEKEANGKLDLQARELAANDAMARERFAQEQTTLRMQHVAQQSQQAREFSQSLERQRRQSEVELILKAAEVPVSLDPAQQDIQRARNLLWFSDAGYLRIPSTLRSKLREAGQISGGQSVSVPVVQSAGGTAALDLVAQLEGFQATPAEIVPGETTVGYGHYMTPEEKKTGYVVIGNERVKAEGITIEQARKLLRQDMQPSFDAVDQLVKVRLSSAQRDALASFAFSVGRRHFENSTLLKHVNAGDVAAVAEEFARWNKAGGRMMQGLTRRRQAEADLWKRPD